jgi:hypothetical protein
MMQTSQFRNNSSPEKLSLRKKAVEKAMAVPASAFGLIFGSRRLSGSPMPDTFWTYGTPLAAELSATPQKAAVD